MVTTDKILHEYNNGNTHVTILTDGTKIREYEDIPIITHPESIDIKLSDCCSMNCEYCHEMSTPDGKHADLDKLLEVIKDLPAGVEIACGGGNPLSHPGLVNFLKVVKSKGLIANLTVNQSHLKEYHDLLVYLIKEEFVYGLGISINSNNFDEIKALLPLTNNIVYHLISGVNDVNIISKLININNCKVLVLGYKDFGRGINYHSDKVDVNLNEWRKGLRKYIGECVLSFDNLAIEQLDVKKWFTDKGWEKFYMGDDYSFTCYYNAVNEYFAPSSRSYDKYFIHDGWTLKTFFDKRNKIQ